jgi:hypothetical protein
MVSGQARHHTTGILMAWPETATLQPGFFGEPNQVARWFSSNPNKFHHGAQHSLPFKHQLVVKYTSVTPLLVLVVLGNPCEKQIHTLGA